MKFGDIPQRLDLVEELQAFEYRITASGNFTADARSGSHDELITCLGLATMMDGGGGLPPRLNSLLRCVSTSSRWNRWDRLHLTPL